MTSTKPINHLNDHGQFQYHTAQSYFEGHQISTLFEALATALALYQPEDPLCYIRESIALVEKKRIGQPRHVIEWDIFIKNHKPNDIKAPVVTISKQKSPIVDIRGMAVQGKSTGPPNTLINKFALQKLNETLHPTNPTDSRALAQSLLTGLGGNLPALRAKIQPKHSHPPSHLKGITPSSNPYRKNNQPENNQPERHDAIKATMPASSVPANLFPSKYIVFVLGGPGSGKGTQCDKIIEKYGYHHLSVGDLLRDQVSKGSDIGKRVDQIMKDGQIVPLEITLTLLKEAMLAAPVDAPGFLIDGFPREMVQANEFEKTIAPCDRVLYFECPLELMQSRLLKRAETSGRADDNLDTIKKRLATFIDKSRPVIEYYEALEKVWTVSSDAPPDQVFANVCTKLDELVLPKPADSNKSIKISDAVKLVFMLGGPGSGKGTQCSKIVQEYGFTHLSTGDLLRIEVAKKTALGRIAESIMNAGQMVPLPLVFAMLSKAITASNSDKILLDGFPRTMEAALMFDENVRKCSVAIYYDCKDNVLVKRLVERGLTSGRSDDNEDTIKMRLSTFHQVTEPIVAHYEELGLLKRIDASNASPEEIYQQTKAILDGL